MQFHDMLCLLYCLLEKKLVSFLISFFLGGGGGGTRILSEYFLQPIPIPTNHDHNSNNQ